MSQKRSSRWPIVRAPLLLVSGAGLVLLGLLSMAGCQPALHWGSAATATPEPTMPAPTVTEPILPPPPTATPHPATTPASETTLATPTARSSPPTAVSAPTHTPSPSPSTVPSPTALEKGLYTPRQRLGVAGSITQDDIRRLSFGWYVDWTVSPGGFQSDEVEYMPMVRLRDGRLDPDKEELLAAVDAMPGATWLIGNEPDVKWQDNMPPDLYAQVYHDLYTLLKGRDPTCHVAIAGVSQPTPLRLSYLDLILGEYQNRYGEPMPVDIWNVHGFVLREERDSWGVDIPPGMSEQTGRLYEIADHDDLAIFEQQIQDFRRWMKERSQQNKPLLVTEYGILMPNDYGFPPGQVEAFMLDTFEYLGTATDPDLGYPADGYRLVQRWCWFSRTSKRYPTGSLVRQDGNLTPLGEAFGLYAHALP
jgi:hypothetical protein